MEMILFFANDTGKEVTRLASKAVCVAPAVFTWCWAGQTDSSAAVLVSALRAMSATLVSKAVEKRSLKNHQIQFMVLVYKLWTYIL